VLPVTSAPAVASAIHPASLVLTRPDDWHLHVRDGAAMAAVVPATARQFARAIVMPNLRPPVITAEQAEGYRQRILAAVPAGLKFEPLMVLYLTDNTNSDAGVTDLRKTYKALEAMQREGLVLCVHGEVTEAEVDVFDREKAFIDDKLIPLRRDFPELKIVFEHITTKEAAQYVNEADRFVGATITPQHLLYNRNAIFMGGVRPHYYCLPILKREEHRLALVQAATSGSPKFFLGTDSAPHASHLKEHASGCAGCYTAPCAIELYAEAFEAAGALDKLEAFASFHGPDYYGLPRNTDTITLKREDWVVPESLPFGEAEIKPLRGGETLHWRLA
jgi:dihydroorotase